MLFDIDPRSVRFEAPALLWLLLAPVLLGALAVRLQWLRWIDRRELVARRTTAVRERLPLAGDLPFWVLLAGALAASVLALARPVVTTALLRTGGVDLIVLQDGSSSTHVMDVEGDRWKRSVRFLRTLGESLRWKDDRVAMAVFAHIAAPQVRLTKDPNTFFFFLDHLVDRSPFPLEEDTTWDTNIELGIYWGLRLVERDEEMNGPSPNAKVFVLVSDGQAWSGEVEKSIQLARAASVPIVVVGVGTTGGGLIPEFVPADDGPAPIRFSPVRSVLDRQSLADIAARGGGRYFELGRDGDRQIANAIIDDARRRSKASGVEEEAVELYWPCVAAAALLAVAGSVFLRNRADLLVQLAAAAAAWVALADLIE